MSFLCIFLILALPQYINAQSNYCNRCYSTTSWEECKSNWEGQLGCGAVTSGLKCYHVEHQFSRPGLIGNNNILVDCFTPTDAATYCDDWEARGESEGLSLHHCLIEECPPEVCQTGFGPFCMDCSSSVSMDDCEDNQKAVQCVEGANCVSVSVDLGVVSAHKKGCVLAGSCSSCSVPLGTCDISCCDEDYCNY